VPEETVALLPRGPDVPSVTAQPAAVGEGDLVKSPDDPAVFVIQDGLRRWIPDEVTLLSRWSWDWVKTVPRAAIDAIPRGPDLPPAPMPLPGGVAEGDLIKAPDHPAVFLVEGGVRRWIPDEPTLLSRWTWDQVKIVSEETIDAIPLGPDLPTSRLP
jgi:hypothetical protein